MVKKKITFTEATVVVADKDTRQVTEEKVRYISKLGDDGIKCQYNIEHLDEGKVAIDVYGVETQTRTYQMEELAFMEIAQDITQDEEEPNEG